MFAARDQNLEFKNVFLEKNAHHFYLHGVYSTKTQIMVIYYMTFPKTTVGRGRGRDGEPEEGPVPVCRMSPKFKWDSGY
jgi:hypothetical protein